MGVRIFRLRGANDVCVFRNGLRAPLRSRCFLAAETETLATFRGNNENTVALGFPGSDHARNESAGLQRP